MESIRNVIFKILITALHIFFQCFSFKNLNMIQVFDKLKIQNRKIFLLIVFANSFSISDFIRSTDHRTMEHQPLTHQPTDPPTNRLNTHQLTRFCLKDLTIERYKLYRTQTQLRIRRIQLRPIIYLMNNVCLYKFKLLQKKSTFL